MTTDAYGWKTRGSFAPFGETCASSLDFTNGVVSVNFTGTSVLLIDDLAGSNTVDLGDCFTLAGFWRTSNPAANLDGCG